jgi:hypothetical protein
VIKHGSPEFGKKLSLDIAIKFLDKQSVMDVLMVSCGALLISALDNQHIIAI